MAKTQESNQEYFARVKADGERCLKAALYYASIGWSPLALCPPDHLGIDKVVTKHSSNCNKPGKRPWHFWKRYQDEPADDFQINQWWKRMPYSNVGMALGPVCDLVRVDVDGASGEVALQHRSGGDLPPTLEFRSGRADGTGRGLMYRIPEGVRLQTTSDEYGEKAELRFQAKGSQTAMPPSRHVDGGLYAWAPGHGPGEIEPAMMPRWVIDVLQVGGEGSHGTHGKRRDAAAWEETFSGALEGHRNENITAIIGFLLHAILDIENDSQIQGVWFSVQAINERNDPPLDEAELLTTFKSILKAERAKRRNGDGDALDRLVAQEIEKSANSKHAASPESSGSSKTPPDWDLVEVQSDPISYLFRSPFWSDSTRLTDSAGYLRLTAAQMFSWSGHNGIRQAAWAQAGKIVPTTMKEWNHPDGHLEKLMAAVRREDTITERKRRLYIMAFIYRYLAKASPLKEDSAGEAKWPTNGKPIIDGDGAYFFKSEHLKEKAAVAHEDFKFTEMMDVVQEFGAVKRQRKVKGRWWRIPKEKFEEMGRQCEEKGGSDEDSDA